MSLEITFSDCFICFPAIQNVYKEKRLKFETEVKRKIKNISYFLLTINFYNAKIGQKLLSRARENKSDNKCF